MWQEMYIKQSDSYVPFRYHFQISWCFWGSRIGSWLYEIMNSSDLGLFSNLNSFIQLAKIYSQEPYWENKKEPYWGCIIFYLLVKYTYIFVTFGGSYKIIIQMQYHQFLSRISLVNIIKWPFYCTIWNKLTVLITLLSYPANPIRTCLHL